MAGNTRPLRSGWADRVVSHTGSAMFGPPRIPARFVAHPRHSFGYGCGSLRAPGARRRASASTQTCVTDY